MNFGRLIQAVADANVEFVIVGGWAAIFHGSARTTQDLDICFSRERANLRKLAVALAPFHPRPVDFPADLPFVWDETTLHNGTVFTLVSDLGRIDLLAEIAGLGDFKQVKAVSVPIRAFGRDVWTLDLPALIQAKKAAGREKDRDALPELESLREAAENDRPKSTT